MGRPKSKGVMTTFKALYSPSQYFRFGNIEEEGEMYEAVDGFFSTDDKDLIEYLRQNTNWQEVQAQVQPLAPIG